MRGENGYEKKIGYVFGSDSFCRDTSDRMSKESRRKERCCYKSGKRRKERGK